MTRLCLYDIGVTHPRDWSVYINPQKLMSFSHGALKLQKLEKQPTDISMTIKWFPLDGFNRDQYQTSLHEALQKKFKHKLHGFQHRKVDLCEHEASLFFFSYADNHSIYKILRKDEEVAEMQALLVCDVSSRIVIASVATIADNMERQAQIFEDMLLRLQCHPLRVRVHDVPDAHAAKVA